MNGCAAYRPARPSHNVCRARLHAPGAGSYIVRVPSHFLPVCLSWTVVVCMHTTNNPQLRRMALAFSFREASNDSTLLPRPRKINVRHKGNRCESTLSGGSQLCTESLTRLSNASRSTGTFIKKLKGLSDQSPVY